LDSKGLRYLEWQYDPDPTDSSYISAMVYMIRDGSYPMIIESDQHVSGLFTQETWLRLFQIANLNPEIVPIPHSQANQRLAILGKKNSEMRLNMSELLAPDQDGL
jgi:hypothetical protein